MPRRRVAAKRDILPDPIYNDVKVTKFINGLMWKGKKSIAEQIFYGAMQKIGEKTGDEPLKVFKNALDQVAPTLEVKSRRIGGATYQVPIEVSKDRRNTLAIRWIVGNARKRSEKTMEDRLVGELFLYFRDHGQRALLVERCLDHRDVVLELDGDAVVRAAGDLHDAIGELVRGHVRCLDGRRIAHVVRSRLRGAGIHLDLGEPHIHPVMTALDQRMIADMGVNAVWHLHAVADVLVIAPA